MEAASGTGPAPAAASERDPRLGRALDYIESNLGRPFSLEEAAEAASWSFFHFHRRFARTFGLGPGTYLRLRRLSEAARDLACGAARVRDIALGRGFGSSEAFGRSFRAAFGLMPTEYRCLSGACASLGPFEPIDRPLLNLTAASAAPSVLRFERVRLAGVGRITRLDAAGLAEDSDRLWDEAGPLVAELAGRGGGPVYQVAFAMGDPGSEGRGGRSIFSVAALALAPGAAPPACLTAFALPAGEYLRALHRGPAALLPRTYLELYASILPRLRRRPLGGFDFDRSRPGAARGDPRSPSYETEVFIPLAPARA